MESTIKPYLLSGLALLAGINAFIPVVPLPLFVFLLLVVQLYVLNKYDNAFVFLILGTVIGAYFAQRGVRFVGVFAILIGCIIAWSDLRRSSTSWQGNLFFILFVLVYLFISVQTTSGGDYATTKLLTTVQTVFVGFTAYTHLFLYPEKHNGRNIALMFLTYSLFMIMVMNKLYGTNLSLSEVLSFGGFRDEFNEYRADNANTFAFNYQMIGLYACLGFSFYLFTSKHYSITDNVFVWLLAALIVVFSTARQTLLIFAVITLLQFMRTKQNKIVKILGVVCVVAIASIWYSRLGVDQQRFILSDFEFSGQSNRTLLRISAMDAFHEHPLFGVGYGRFVFANQYGVNEHNIVVELLAELGLIGTLCLVVPLLFISFPLKRNKVFNYYLPYFAIITAYFIHFMLSSQFSEGIILFIIIPLLKLVPLSSKAGVDGNN